MSAQMTPTSVSGPSGLVQLGSTPEELIRQKLAEERARLEAEYGVQRREVHHFKRPVERLFTKADRGKTTILFGGLTWKHEKLIHGALESLGYKCEAVPTPDVRAFQLGKEYGNNGQCNPTYFTVGNLVQYLQRLEEQGMTKQDILDRYVFFTAGACGPCRFGMYEAEYRLALRNSGFDGFRVMLFQQGGGLNQAEAEAGLEMNLEFFLGILNAMNMGDLINEVAYLIRPYELNKGETDAALEELMDFMHGVMKRKQPWRPTGWLAKAVRDRSGLESTANYLGQFLSQIFGDSYLTALGEVRDRFNEIKVDRFRVKPIVKITGEFWAQTTEGDGNFNMFRFLEREGAQILVEPIGTWIMYMLHQAIQETRDRRGLEDKEVRPPRWDLPKRIALERKYYKKLATLKVAEKVFRREYHRVKDALGGIAHGLTDQYELQRVGHPYYNSRAGGGEGHLEVAKNIYYSNRELCHMVLSMKPFGCMPSTQSDGAQSAVVAHYKDMIFLPIETSGEGEVNAHSRVQMALGEAKAKAKLEFAEVMKSTGKTLDQLKEYVEEHPELQRPMYHVPKYKGIIGTAANFARHISNLIDGAERLGQYNGHVH